MSSPSLRDIARSLGLSHTTVSEALRDSPRVRPETRSRVLRAAAEAGYQANPLAGALMSEMRRSRAGTFRGVLAIVDLDGPDSRTPTSERYHRELAAGAKDRAEALGFKAEPFVLGRQGMTVARLDGILRSRGIRGLFLLPVSDAPDLSQLEWSRYAGVYADYIIERPPLHSVCADHFRSMMTALHHLQQLGYRRPGLVLQHHHDERLLHRWEAAYRIFPGYGATFQRTDPLIVPEINRGAFVPWFRKEKPDVVLCHRAEVLDWMTEVGARIPDTHGFCCLNVRMNTTACAGLDLKPRELGARGIELLIGQLLHNEYGAPGHPSTTTIPAAWVDGPTLRQN